MRQAWCLFVCLFSLIKTLGFEASGVKKDQPARTDFHSMCGLSLQTELGVCSSPF